MENSINDNYITIRGSYSSTVNWDMFDFLNTKNINDNLINNYNEEKKHLENEVYEIEFNNIYLLNCIYFLDRRCNFKNITHSNTINFIIAHYRELKQLLDKTIYNYNKNLYNISLLNEKIYEINMTIYNLKQNFCFRV